jgi:hypothetical protein
MADRVRAPRGMRPVVDGFFAALGAVPGARQQEVGKAAIQEIRAGLAELKASAKADAAEAKAAKAAKPKKTGKKAAKGPAKKGAYGSNKGSNVSPIRQPRNRVVIHDLNEAIDRPDAA